MPYLYKNDGNEERGGRLEVTKLLTSSYSYYVGRPFSRAFRGSRGVKNVTGRVGSGRAKRLSNLVGRVRSGQEFFKSHGSGRVGSRGDEKLTGRVRS